MPCAIRSSNSVTARTSVTQTAPFSRSLDSISRHALPGGEFSHCNLARSTKLTVHRSASASVLFCSPEIEWPILYIPRVWGSVVNLKVVIFVKRGIMGGGEYRTKEEGEGSLARDWWNRASSKSADQESSQESSQDEAGKASPSQETEDLACLTAVVPRPQQQPPPGQPAKSKPIDIPKKKTTPPPVFEVAKDKRYWYQ